MARLQSVKTGMYGESREAKVCPKRVEGRVVRGGDWARNANMKASAQSPSGDIEKRYAAPPRSANRPQDVENHSTPIA